MGKCLKCGRETESHASVFVGYPAFHEDTKSTTYRYEKSESFLCQECTNEQMSHDYSGALFYIALQIFWLTVLKNGIKSLSGSIALLICLFGLWRLTTLLFRRAYQRKRPGKELPKILYRSESNDDAASDLLKSLIQEREAAYGRKVQSNREYFRNRNKPK